MKFFQRYLQQVMKDLGISYEDACTVLGGGSDYIIEFI